MQRVTLEGDLWDRFYLVHPLVIIGTLEEDGSHDLAPKHMAMPMSWEDHFGFVCSKTHRTWQNATRTGVFTVSYPGPDQTLLASLASAPRTATGEKPALAAISTQKAEEVDGELLPGDDCDEVAFHRLSDLPDELAFQNDRIILERLCRGEDRPW